MKNGLQMKKPVSHCIYLVAGARNRRYLQLWTVAA